MYDIIVIGAGHAGCEAALAAARMGCKTLLLTMNLDNIALMPCNPSIGGPAKGHLVREIDALGGEMARNIDKTFIQIRMLNTGKGPAVQALRAQADKKLYGLSMRRTLEQQDNLYIKQALIEEIGCSHTQSGQAWPCLWVKDNLGSVYETKCLILTTGTSLAGRIIIGDKSFTAGRAGEFSATGLSQSLRNMGFTLGRLKTGTPPRLDARTIDFSQTVIEPGSPVPLYFSAEGSKLSNSHFPAVNSVYPQENPTTWRPQLPCYLVYTNDKTHELIRANLHRAPLYSGVIKGIGPRYCPSIEDKIVRFANKERHGLFLEPEGWQTSEVYVQGANTSLPEDIQLAMLRTIPALRHVEMIRVGYAIEYDYVPTTQTLATLESKTVPGLFFAGQINGTTGYEEAAGQGLIAGINAVLKIKGKPPFILKRDQGYLGVMIDDLITRELSEPYRLLTCRAEYRLLLRQDNADLRLCPIGYDLGLVGRERYEAVEAKRTAVDGELKRLAGTFIGLTQKNKEILERYGLPLNSSISTIEFLRRQNVSYSALKALGLDNSELAQEILEQVEIEAKYGGYIRQQQIEVDRLKRLENKHIPDGFDYESIPSLRHEARFKLNRFRPVTLGQASRIDGVTPADVAILIVYLERARHGVISQGRGQKADA